LQARSGRWRARAGPRNGRRANHTPMTGACHFSSSSPLPC
jgi:hypothetical protein